MLIVSVHMCNYEHGSPVPIQNKEKPVGFLIPIELRILRWAKGLLMRSRPASQRRS